LTAIGTILQLMLLSILTLSVHSTKLFIILRARLRYKESLSSTMLHCICMLFFLHSVLCVFDTTINKREITKVINSITSTIYQAKQTNSSTKQWDWRELGEEEVLLGEDLPEKDPPWEGLHWKFFVPQTPNSWQNWLLRVSIG